ncbi:MAG: polysaccharide deacetylase family protein [Clostridia bacterium]
MEEKTNKKNKIKILLFIVVLLILVLAIAVVVIFIIKAEVKNNNEIHVVREKSNYQIKIDYPVTHIKKIDDEIEKYITYEKEMFISTVKQIKEKADAQGDKDITNEENLENKEATEESKYQFLLQSNTSEYKNTKSINIVIYEFVGGNHYERKDKNICFNVNDGSSLTLDDFFEDKTYLDKISKIAYYKVNKYLEDNAIEYDEQLVKQGTEAKIENYTSFVFKEDGLNITFLPYQVASWSSGEIKITIGYNKINNLLKEKYRGTSIKTGNIDIVKKERDLSKFAQKKLIAITFDDGPSYITSNLIDELNKRDAKATFFVMGSRVEKYKDTLKKAYEQGHQIGTHTCTHRALTKLDDYQIMSEINKSNDEIEKVIGVTTNLLRPPYGSINDHVKQLADMNIILWNVDTLDWKNKNANKISDEIINKASDGNIVLLHDLYPTSVEGAIKAIDVLEKEGYAFVTIDEMCKLKNIKLDSVKSYFKF